MVNVLIAPSILSCNFLELGREIKEIDEAGCDLIHVDVMDGHFVPNITVGPMIVDFIRNITEKPLDCHLMVERPYRLVKDFIKAGSDIITVHVESDAHILRTIDMIKGEGKKAGVTLNPGTSLHSVEEILPYVDVLLIMTVNPGFGGQPFIPSMYDKIKKAKDMIEKVNRKVHLEVDGGIKVSNAKKVVLSGADILVMGTEIFGSKNYKQKITEVRNSVGE
ncbi:MAG: ribulose-phosphate 3-epimerase [Deltaproteobacteria bacterium]|nr:ribulose-phosphate 3-epimerase [Deltaproteobacteria bacterium]